MVHALVEPSQADGDFIVQLVTHRAQEALNVQRETDRRISHYQQGKFLADCHQDEAGARQNLVSVLARHNEAHNENAKIHV